MLLDYMITCHVGIDVGIITEFATLIFIWKNLKSTKHSLDDILIIPTLKHIINYTISYQPLYHLPYLKKLSVIKKTFHLLQLKNAEKGQ